MSVKSRGAPDRKRKKKATPENSPELGYPNSEEDEPMGGGDCFCGQPERRAMLECSLCKDYTHYECTGLGVLELCNVINEDPGLFVCKACVPQLNPSVISELKEPNPSCHVHMYKEPVPPAPTGGLSEDTMRRIIVEATAAATKAATTAVMDFMKDHLEKEGKKNNLVIVGFPVEKSDQMAQRALDDKKVGDVCQKLGIPQESIQSTFREGRDPSKSVLKVCFKDRFVTERRMFLFQGTRALKDTGILGPDSRAYVRADLTWKERQADIALRAELRKRREVPGAPDLVIRNGRIVPRGGGRPGGRPGGQDPSGNGIQPVQPQLYR